MSKNEDGSTMLVWVIFRIKSFTTHLNFVSQLFRNIHHDLQRHIENVRGGRRRKKKEHEKGENDAGDNNEDGRREVAETVKEK